MASTAQLMAVRQWVGSSVADDSALDDDLARLGEPLVVALERLSILYADRLEKAAQLNLSGDASISWVENIRHLASRVKQLAQACAALPGLNDEATALVSAMGAAARNVDVVQVAPVIYQNVRRS